MAAAGSASGAVERTRSSNAPSPAEKGAGPRPLRRYEWTQGLPNGGDHAFRLAERQSPKARTRAPQRAFATCAVAAQRGWHPLSLLDVESL